MTKTLCYAKLTSKYVSVLAQISGILAIQYFRSIVCRARRCSSGGKTRAVAANSGPVTFPRIVHGATFTCGLLRMRLALPMSLRVITYSFPSSSPNQTGVGTPTPVLRNVVNEMYFCPRMAEGIWLVIGRILEAGTRGNPESSTNFIWMLTFIGLPRSSHLCYKPEHA